MEKQKRAFFNFILLSLATITASACASAAVETKSTKELVIEAPKDPVDEGGIFYLTVKTDQPVKELVGHFQDKVIEFFPDTTTGKQTYSAVVGVPFGTEAKAQPFSIRLQTDGKLIEETIQVAVKPGKFPSEVLRVPPRTVTPSKKDQVRIKRDQALLKKAYAVKTEMKLWDPPAIAPIPKQEVTSVFGTSRVYNGKKTNVHLGTDLRAPTGTPIIVPLTGKVALARFLFYTGYTVILDHGYGMFTIYAHLSKLKVKEGQVVKKGQIMGKAGATGRASGPHLHWGVHLHGTKVDPIMMVQALK